MEYRIHRYFSSPNTLVQRFVFGNTVVKLEAHGETCEEISCSVRGETIYEIKIDSTDSPIEIRKILDLLCCSYTLVSGYNEHDVGDLTVHIIPEEEKDDWFWIGKSLHVLEYDEYWYYAILLSSQVYGDSQAVNAITRYYSAHKIVDLHPMDLDPSYDPITNEYLLSEQINIANCIVSCYTALEEINLHVDFKLSLFNEDKTSWNPDIYFKTTEKLKNVGINPSMEIMWLTRGDEDNIQKDNILKNLRLCEWSGGEISDRYTTPVDALLRIKYLRNKAGAHSEAGIINSLSIYDAENAFSLCRILLMLKFEIYHYLFKEE